MKKQMILLIYLSYCLLFVLVVAAIVYSIYSIRVNSKSESDAYLTQITFLCAQSIDREINKDLDILQMLAKNLLTVQIKNLDDITYFFKQLPDKQHFMRKGIITPDGMAYTADGKVLNVEYREYFKLAMNGEANISPVLNDAIDDTLGIVFSVPVFSPEGTVVAVIFATKNVKTYSEQVYLNPLSGVDQTFIVNNAGFYVALPPAYGDFLIKEIRSKTVFDVMRSTKISNSSYSTFYTQIANQLAGLVHFSHDEKWYIMAYAPIPTKNWMILVVGERDKIAINTNKLILENSALGALLITIIFIVFFVLYTRENRNQREIEKIAFIDSVTGFSNWEKFKRDAEKLIRNSQINYAIISFETYNFRMYNDVYGHDHANIFLQKIAECIHTSCNLQETFCRFSADNFIVLAACEDSADIEHRIADYSTKINEIDETSIATCRFGVYFISNRSLSIGDCSDKAFMAKVLARQSLHESVVYYDEAIRKKIVEENEFESIMENSLANGEFVMYLQPKVNVQNCRVNGAEALVRWKHFSRGLVSPAHFLPLFERNGFITRIDFEICRQACVLIRTWLEKGVTPIPISVNFSRLHLHKQDFVDNINTIVDFHGVPHKYIEIEITETIAETFDHGDYLKDIILRFQQNGYKVSMDDFGSGFSSLNMLAKLPVDVLKMDKRFFDDMISENSKSVFSVITRVIDLAKDLNMEIVAEGIETQQQYDILLHMKCDMIQGYYFSPPLTIEGFEHFLFICNEFALLD